MEKELMIPTDDYFESTLSSMVSSPTSGDGMMIRELIGRLCDSSPQSCIATPDNTPLNSPPKLYLHTSTNFPNHPPTLPFFNADPGFAERAAKFSSFGTNLQLHGNSHRPLMLDSTEPSSVSQHNPVGEIAISRKRKSISKPKLKDSKGETKKNEGSPNAKRSKTDEDEAKKENAEESKDNNNYNNNNSNNNYNNNSNNNDNDNISNNKETANPEPPKDYIHVRARRGQATDSHSLAERVRREKISERMKFLQDLVPGCNKVTGKATVLDEIINYVQSLQHQVEFLSMKLATMNPRMDFNILSKDMFQCRESALPQTMYPLDQTFGLQPPSIGGLTDPLTQFPTFWDDDLQSLVQMGIAQNQTQTGSGTLSKTQMKAEL